MPDPRNQLHQRDKVLDSEARPPAPKAQVGVRRRHVGPAHGHDAARTVGKFQSNPRLAVEFLGDIERKCRCRRTGETGELSEHGNQMMDELHLQAYAKGKMKLIFAEIMRELKASGYRVSARLMNAMYFGVPQSRERMIFIGMREDLAA